MRRITVILASVLLLTSARAPAQEPQAQAQTKAAAAAPLLVFDPANLLTAVQQLAEAIAQVKAVRDHILVSEDILEVEEDIWNSQTKIRPIFAALTNNSEYRLNHRRYMPADWECAMRILEPGGGGCTVGSHQNDWLNSVYDTAFEFDNLTPEQLMERYGSGAMLEPQQTYMRYSMGASNAAMASSIAVQEDIESRTAGVEALIEELRRGSTTDIQGMMGLNARMSAEVAISLQTLIRLQAQSLYLQALQQQGGVTERRTAAQMMTAFRQGWDPVASQPMFVTEQEGSE